MKPHKKIIQILCHTLINDDNLMYHVYGGFGAKQARGIKPYVKGYRFEIWYAVTGLRKKTQYKKDGLVYRLFPARTLSKIMESYFGLIWCPDLFKELSNEEPENTIIHFQGEHGSLLHQLLHSYPQYNVVLQYHGYGQAAKLNFIEKLFITPVEKLYFPRIRHFFVPIKPRIEYLTRTIGINRARISTENIGINYRIFKPLDKNASRRKLHIPGDVFVMLYVGPFLESKGVKLIVETYNLLKKRHRNLYLLFVGGNKTDPLYALGSQYADKIMGMTDNSGMPVIYAASDVLCFYGNEKMRMYAGPGIAPTEALACNLNVISTNLSHFPDTISDTVGFIPKSNDEFTKRIEFLIENRGYKINSRRIVEKYVSFEHIGKKIGLIYDGIFKQTTHKN